MRWEVHFMGVKVFVLGLPGSGKSAAARCIQMLARDKEYTVKGFNDYHILRAWFEKAPDGPQFSRTEHGGFDIHDLTVFDTSLRELELRISQEATFSEKELILIEFARADYLNAFKQFSSAFLQDAYFLFIDAEISVCKERVWQRFINRSSSDDHYVSDYIYDTYYHIGREYCSADELNMIRDQSEEYYNVNAQKMKKVYNGEKTSLISFHTEIEQDTLKIIEQKDLEPQLVEKKQKIEHTLPTCANRN